MNIFKYPPLRRLLLALAIVVTSPITIPLIIAAVILYLACGLIVMTLGNLVYWIWTGKSIETTEIGRHFYGL